MTPPGAKPTPLPFADQLWTRWARKFGTQIESGVIGAQVGDAEPALFPEGQSSQRLFPVGSVTKLVTGLCIARLMAQDPTLTVNTHVNQLLGPYRLAGRYAEQVTLAHLLTHRSGYDYSDFGLAYSKRQSARIDALNRFEPPFACRPAGLPAYSNFGAAVLGRVLEHQLQKPFSRIAHDWVFAPLGLHNAVIANNDTDATDALPLHPFFQAAGGLLLNVADGIRLASFFSDPSSAPHELQAPLRLVSSPLYETPSKTIGIGLLASRFMARGVLVAGHTGSWPGRHAVLLFIPEHRAALFCALTCSNTLDPETPLLWGAALDLLLDAVGATASPPALHKIRPYVYASTKVPTRSPERALHLWAHPLAYNHHQLEPPALKTEVRLYDFCSDGPVNGQWFMRSSQREAFVRAPLIRVLYPFSTRAALLALPMISWPVAGWLAFGQTPPNMLTIATALSVCSLSACILLSRKNLHACILVGDKRPIRLLTLLALGVVALTIVITAGAHTMVSKLSGPSLAHFLIFIGAAWIFSIAFLDMRIAFFSVHHWASLLLRHRPRPT